MRALAGAWRVSMGIMRSGLPALPPPAHTTPNNFITHPPGDEEQRRADSTGGRE